MITNKGRSIIARSLCEQMNDPFSYIAIGIGKWSNSEAKDKQTLACEVARFKVNSSAPFQINEQMAVMLNANMPAVGRYHVWEMGIFTASNDILLTSNPSQRLWTTPETGTDSLKCVGDNATKSKEIRERMRLGLQPTEIKGGESLTIQISNLATRYYDGDIIKVCSPYKDTDFRPELTFTGQEGSVVFDTYFYTGTTTTPATLDPTKNWIEIDPQGYDPTIDNNKNTDDTKGYHVDGYVLADKVIQKLDTVGKLSRMTIKNTAAATKYMVLDHIRYDSVNHLNAGYAMVSYLPVDTGVVAFPFIKKMDGEEAIISYEMIINNPS